mmetsp:Transcript_43591/g.100843  ORF Transcript_43591/g.100843 Transcript_43591/m.100843 type:complete len:370 (+) Transcript_43591:314-1423(+)
MRYEGEAPPSPRIRGSCSGPDGHHDLIHVGELERHRTILLLLSQKQGINRVVFERALRARLEGLAAVAIVMDPDLCIVTELHRVIVANGDKLARLVALILVKVEEGESSRVHADQHAAVQVERLDPESHVCARFERHLTVLADKAVRQAIHLRPTCGVRSHGCELEGKPFHSHAVFGSVACKDQTLLTAAWALAAQVAVQDLFNVQAVKVRALCGSGAVEELLCLHQILDLVSPLVGCCAEVPHGFPAASQGALHLLLEPLSVEFVRLICEVPDLCPQLLLQLVLHLLLPLQHLLLLLQQRAAIEVPPTLHCARPPIPLAAHHLGHILNSAGGLNALPLAACIPLVLDVSQSLPCYTVQSFSGCPCSGV